MEALKSMIRGKLHSSPYVARALEERPDLKDDSAGLLQFLEERGLIENIFTSLEADLGSQQQTPYRQQAVASASSVPHALVADAPTSSSAPRSSASHQLRLSLKGGMAFLDFLEELDARGRKLCWHVSFGKERA